MNQCQFELKPLYCHECGAYIGEEGTCEEMVFCPACSSKDGIKRNGILLQPDYDELGNHLPKYQVVKVRR